jgi:16S rRNA (cytosine967-C5)-methyltransferase
MTTVRLAAARVLMSLERGRTTLAAETERARRPIAEARDRALLLELVAGTLRWQRALDLVLGAVARRNVAQLDAPVRAVLRLGAYQLLHLERIPAHAVVHESVDVVRAAGRPKAAGLVNAVLRSIAGNHGRDRLPPRPAAEAGRAAQLTYLGATLSHPSWLVERWLDRYGFEATEQWCQFNNSPPEITVRSARGEPRYALVDDLAAAGARAIPSPFAPEAIRLPAGSYSRLLSKIRSRLSIQDEGSQLIAHAVQAPPGGTVLDVCAAPGGKTIVMATAMENTGLLVAADRRPARVALLAATIARTAMRAQIVRLDATRPLPFPPRFDRVLLDAPCSGLGTLRRDPDLKWSRQPEDLEGLANAQRQMLGHAADAVGAGGALVYATCSSEPEENALVVEAFLAAHPEFTLERALPPDAPGSDVLIDSRGYLITTPFQHGLDAFFAARLVRRRGA